MDGWTLILLCFKHIGQFFYALNYFSTIFSMGSTANTWLHKSLLVASKLHHFLSIWQLFQNILKPDFIILMSWPTLILWQCGGSWLCGLAWSKRYCATLHNLLPIFCTVCRVMKERPLGLWQEKETGERILQILIEFKNLGDLRYGDYNWFWHYCPLKH